MFVRSSDFDPSLTQSEVDDIINALAVNVYDFSNIACLEGRVYGVTTKCQNCNLEINYCLRNEIARKLYASQQLTERRLGYDISPQYHHAQIPFGYTGKIRLPHRNVIAVNVEQAHAVISGYESVTVNPYIQENITIQADGAYCIAVFSASLVDNPAKAIIRDENGRLYEQQEVATYPRRVAGNWQVPIMGLSAPCDNGLEFNVQHCELIRVTMAKPTCTGRTLPVYPDSHQVIPTFKVEDDGVNLTLWFHVWALARPEFMDDGIDFSRGDFYKLYDAIDIMCFTDVTKNATVTVVESENCEWVFGTSTAVPNATILDGESGIVYVDASLLTCSSCANPFSHFCGQELPLYLNIWYKTSPTVMTKPFQFVAIRDAIAYYTAAELPVTACTCTITEGFIFQAQTSFVGEEINPFNGATIQRLDYRKIYGRLRYEELMSKVPVYSYYGSI